MRAHSPVKGCLSVIVHVSKKIEMFFIHFLSRRAMRRLGRPNMGFFQKCKERFRWWYVFILLGLLIVFFMTKIAVSFVGVIAGGCLGYILGYLHKKHKSYP